MNKTVILALAAAILFSASAPAVFSPPGTSAEAMIVLHAESGAVLAVSYTHLTLPTNSYV